MATYIKFGENEVDYDQLMLNAANEVYNFVKRLPWSNKRKESFMRAYSDIASRGITSAGIGENGLWNINYNGEDLSAESEMDKQMLGAAADFFINQMHRLPTKASLEEDAKKKKEDLPIFNNSYFTQQFHGKIGTDWFGGIDWKQSEWNDFDKRGENGLRGTTKRAERLANTLENYSASLKEGEHNFEGSPFTDLNDFKTRVNNVVSVLRNGTPDQYKDALYSIGLRYDDYFNDGSGDIRGTLDDGTPVTYGLYNEYLAKLQKLELEQKLKQQLEAQQARQKWILENKLYFHRSNPHIMGLDLRSLGAKYGNTQALISKLNEYSQKGLESLNPDEMSELVGAFRYGTRLPINNDLYNLIRQSSVAFKNSRITDFEALPGVEGAIWHKPTGTVLSFKNNAQRTAVDFDFLKGYSKEAQELLLRTAAKDRKFLSTFRDFNGARYTDPDGSHNITTGLKDLFVDSLRAQALIADIGAVVASFVPGYGTALSAGLGVGGLVSELLADVADEGVSWGEVGERLLANAGFAALGLLPGGKLGKVGSKLVKYALPAAGMVFSTAAGKQMLEDPEFRKSWNKLVDGKFDEITGGDALNYVKFLGIAAGITSGGRAIYSSAKYGRLATGSSPTKTIKTSKGKVPVTDEQLSRLNEIGNKEGNPKANEYLNETIIGNKNAGHEVLVDFNPGKISGSKYNPLRTKVEAETTYSRTPNQERTIENYRKKSEAMHRGEGIYRFVPKIIREGVPTDYDMYFGGNPFWGKFTKGEFDLNKKPNPSSLNPIRQTNNQLTPKFDAKDPKINPSLNHNDAGVGVKHTETSDVVKIREGLKLWRENNHDRFSNNPLVSGESSFGNSKLLVVEQTDGTFNIIFKGNIVGNYRNLKELLRSIFNIIKSQTKPELSTSSSKISPKEIAKYLVEYKKKGWLKQGGTINNNKIKRYRNFISK